MGNSGNTPLLKNDESSKKFGFNILIKDESKNPFGTFKDRRSELIIKKAKDDQIDKLVLITSGNAGYSLGKFAYKENVKVVSIVDKHLKSSIKKKLRNYGKVIETDLSKRILKPEEVISLACENDEEIILDVTNDFHEAYEEIIKELKKANPGFVIVPVGSGEGFVGLYNGIKKHKLKTKLIGVSVKNKWQSFADKLHTPWTPYKSKIQSILKEGHSIIKLEEEEIKDSYKEYKNKFDIEPSSAVVFAVLPKLSKLSKIKLKKEDKIILINSGKGIL